MRNRRGRATGIDPRSAPSGAARTGTGGIMTTRPEAPPSPALKRDRQLALYHRAARTLPGGTNSNFRAWGEDTVYIDRGKGGRIWDQDQNEYIDLRMGYGPVILGHGDDRVDDYVNEQMRKGVSFSLTSEDEVRAMELVCELTGWVDMARMTVSGTEATMHAMRLARAFTGRNKIVKFEGQYHGVHAYALISGSPDDMSELGAFAKAMGNGYPAAAFGGRRDIMSQLPDKVSHGGTYAGNRVAAAAAVKTLEIIRDTNALETIHATGRRIQDGLREVLNPSGIPYVFTGHPSMFGIMFIEEVPTEYRDWAKSDHALYDAVALG